MKELEKPSTIKVIGSGVQVLPPTYQSRVQSIYCADDSHSVRNILLQYRLWSFQAWGTKLERFLPKNQHTQKKLLNFEFWINHELSKIGHHFSNKVM